MDKSDNSQYKSLCYNCLYKLQTNDIAHKVCPKCRMSINKDGLPLKGSSNSSWRKSDTGNKEIDESINKNIALDQGFHYGKITRLRYGITEGNYGNWIVNPDKSFEFRYRNDDLVINRYKLTDSATGIKKTSSLNIIRNGLKEMLTNSQHTPSILYLELKETKLNYPTHIILLEEKFLTSRFGKHTGLNLLLNLIHTNNFFPVTAALHRKTIIYKVSDNYEKSISTSYLMPSSGLKVIERIPHNHLSLFNDEVELKKDIEQSLKFLNIKAIHQYIPTLVNKSSLFFSANSKDEVGIINDQDGQDDDNMSQLSDISVSSVGEVTIKKVAPIIKKVVPIIKKVVPNLEHMGISNQIKSESEPTPLVNKKSTIFPIKDTRVIDDKSQISKEDTYDSKKAVLEHMGIFGKETEKTNKSEKYKQISSPDTDSLSQESIGIDFLGDTTRSTYSNEILETTSDAPGNERIYEEPSQERIGIDFLGDSNSQYTSDEDMLEGKQISEDGDKSVDDDWQAESIETISGEEEEKGVGIDFLGKEQNYKKQLDNSKNTNKLIVDFNDSGDEHDDEEVSFIKHDPKDIDSENDGKDIDSENDSKDISLKNTVSLIDLPDYATPLHDFWGEFNKTKISVRNSAKKHSKKDTIQYETDEESDITIDDDSDQEKEPEKKTKPRIRKKKKTEEKEPEKKTKPRTRKKKKTEEKEPEKKTKPKRSSKKKTEKNEPKKKPKTKRSSKKKTGGNTTSKKRDTKGRYISSSKKGSSNKTKSKSIKKTAKKTSSDKKRDSSGKYVSSKKNKRGGSRTRDTKGRFKPVR